MTDHQMYVILFQAWLIAGLCKHKSEPWHFVLVAILFGIVSLITI